MTTQLQVPQGPRIWPPTQAWPPAVHAGINQLKAMAHQWRNADDDSTGPILVAVSGGADSLALAVIAAETQRTTGITFGAIVLDHQLQHVTAKVARRTAEICGMLRLEPVLTERLSVTDHGDGLEAAAREARYAAFVRCAHEVDAAGVVTAHTANDQAEQVLLGIARGSGARSIAGIRKQRHHNSAGYQPIRIGRPILELTRQGTEAICTWAGLRYFQDPMNFDDDVARIRVRNHLLPTLTDPSSGLGPGVFSGLTTTAALAAEDADLLDELAEESYRALADEETHQISFSLAQLRALKPAILRRVVARAVRQFDAPQPTSERLRAVQELIFPPVGVASSAGPIQLEGHVSLYRKKATNEYAKLLVICSPPSE
ncbi:MAG: tRNA lysidine(34) synthetase TilS [Micrococcaceae bacterium]|nr:tRNA lysidine(34) synthetase TilS [Micrococcaceae bacterium]